MGYETEQVEERAGGTASPIRVLVVDDHEVVAASLAAALDDQPDIITVGVATSLAQARRRITSELPDVILLDNRLPDGEGVAAIPELRALRPSAHVVVLTGAAADQVLVQAMEAGASGFLSKTRSLAELTGAVRAAAVGESVISPELLRRLLPQLGGTPSDVPRLTRREQQVLTMISEGLSNGSIADELHVSVHTVRNHVANLSSKLGAHSKLEALAIAVREGLLPGA
jgi:DNA-binding NarL/FixJ family response regulator